MSTQKDDTDQEPKAAPNTEQPITAKSGSKRHPQLVKVEFPTKVTPFVWLAMLAGFLLAALSFAPLLMANDWKPQSSIMLGAGVGIILAAFGGQATIAGRFFVFAGVAAIAGGLIWFLEHRQDQDAENQRGILAAFKNAYGLGAVNDVPAGYSVRLLIKEPILGRHDARDRQFQFVVFGDETSLASRAVLELEQRDAPNPETTLVRLHIPVACLKQAIGSDDHLDWSIRFAENDLNVVDARRNGVVIGQPDLFGLSNPCKAPEVNVSTAPTTPHDFARTAAALFETLIGTAEAQSGKQIEPLTDAQIDTLLSDILVDDSYVRRSARDELANVQTSQIPILMEALHSGSNTYRTKLGISVALAEKLRQDKRQSEAVSEVLTDQDRDLLLNLAGDPDRTVRVYAVEFLYDLGDPEVTSKAIERASQTDNAESRYLWLFAAQGGWDKLAPTQQTELKTDLEQIQASAGRQNPKTQKLIAAFD